MILHPGTKKFKTGPLTLTKQMIMQLDFYMLIQKLTCYIL